MWKTRIRVWQNDKLPICSCVKCDPILKSIFDRIRSGQPFKTGEFELFIAPLVQDFEAAAAHFMDEQGSMPGGQKETATVMD